MRTHILLSCIMKSGEDLRYLHEVESRLHVLPRIMTSPPSRFLEGDHALAYPLLTQHLYLSRLHVLLKMLSVPSSNQSTALARILT
jgi:hypothetical protein